MNGDPKFDVNPHKSLESLKGAFSEKLEKLMSFSINPRNIDHIFDDFLIRLVSLTEEVILNYIEQSGKENAHVDKKDLEDAAFEYFNLSGINNLLDLTQRKLTDLQKARAIVNEFILPSETVITPPDEGNSISPRNEEAEAWKEKPLIPRLQTLLYILIADGMIEQPKDVNIAEGKITDNMMRNEPYFRVEISSCARLVYICDEEGNASYVFDTQKLEELRIQWSDVDTMTKEEKNEFIKAHGGSGIRYIYSPKWITVTRSYLYNPLPVEEKDLPIKENMQDETLASILETEKLPQVIKDSNHEWYGFWIDPETGEHWAGDEILAKRVGMTKATLALKYSGNILSNKLKILNGRIVGKAYSFEQAMASPEVKKSFEAMSVAREGTWAGFWEDPETKEHWGSAHTISKKLDMDSHTITTRYEGSTLDNKLNDLYNRPIKKAYSYEQASASSEIQKIVEATSVETEGIWAGFWEDPETKEHWGAAKTIVNKMNMLNHFLTTNYSGTILEDKLKDTKNRPIKKAYSYEQAMASPVIKKTLEATSVAIEGEWVGFWQDPKTGEHWGGANAIREKLGIKHSSTFFSRYVGKTLDSKLKGLNGQLIETAYSFEQAVGSSKIKETVEATSVAVEGEWAGFWQDPETEEHWGAFSTIGKKLGISPDFLRANYEGNFLPNNKLKDISGKLIGSAYSYEQAIRSPKIKLIVKKTIANNK